MKSRFRIDVPFETRPPRLKDLVDQYVMGDVWIRDTPFGPVTDSNVIAERFNLKHLNVLRAISKCRSELGDVASYQLDKNLIESHRWVGPKGKQREERKASEFRPESVGKLPRIGQRLEYFFVKRRTKLLLNML
jgi:hypothetical protein